MNVTFLGQGYNLGANTSVAQALIDSFANNDFHTFKCMVAFASPSGVSGLTEHVNNSRAHIKTTRVVIGIDQGATSKEALEKLLEWDADVFVFYSAQVNIFHPKIYIFEGDSIVSIIIGSNNLTEMGLVKNIEGAVLITFNKDDIEGDNLLDEITNYFNPLLTGDTPNLKPLTAELIGQLVEEGIIPTEVERRMKYSKDLSPTTQEDGNDTPIIENIRTLFPSIGLQSLPENFNPIRTPKVSGATMPVSSNIIPNPPVILVNNSGWLFTDDTQVLVAEIGGPSRWKQISFSKENFENFFHLPIIAGESSQLNLKYIENNGDIQNDIEIISSVSKGSSNYNLEPLRVRESTVPYDHANRPIIFFIKINATNFIYHFETSGSQQHNELQQLFPARVGNSIRRRLLTVADLRANCPSINL